MSLAAVVQKSAARAIKSYGAPAILTHTLHGAYNPATGGFDPLPTVPALVFTPATTEAFTPSGTSGALAIGGTIVEATPQAIVNAMIRTDLVTRTITNYHLHSEDLTTWAKTGAGSSTATTATDSDATASTYFTMVSPIRPADNYDLYTWSGRITKGTTIVALSLLLTGGSTPAGWFLGIDTATGLWTPIDNPTRGANVCILDGGAYWDVSVILLNNHSGNTNCTTLFYPAYCPNLDPINPAPVVSTTGTSGLTKVMLESYPLNPFLIYTEGDSQTIDTSYPTWPNALGCAKGFDLLNGAVTGTTTADARARFDTNKGGGFSHFLIMDGVNDVAGSVALATTQANLTYMWSGAAALGMTVVAITIPPWAGAAAWSSTKQTNTETLNAWIRAQALANGYALVDAYALLEDPANLTHLLPAYDSTDHLHPNGWGRELIGRAVHNALGLTIPHSAYVGPTVAAAVTSSLATPVQTKLWPPSRTNLAPNPTFTGGGFAPTSWTALVGTGTSAPVSSFLGADATAYLQTSDGTTRPCFYASIAVQANTTYTLSHIVEAVTGTQTADAVLTLGAQPAGTTFSYPVCSANPHGGTGWSVTPGVLLVQVVVAGTAGNIQVRQGLGVNGAASAGSYQFSRFKVEPGKARTSFHSGTMTDLAVSGPNVTLGQTASGTYTWGGSGTVNVGVAPNPEVVTPCFAVLDASSQKTLGFKFGEGLIRGGDMLALLTVPVEEQDTLTVSDVPYVVVKTVPIFVKDVVVSRECLVRR